MYAIWVLVALSDLQFCQTCDKLDLLLGIWNCRGEGFSVQCSHGSSKGRPTSEMARHQSHWTRSREILGRIILTRLGDAIDKQLPNEQAGFRPDWSCADQTPKLRIIIKRCNEMISQITFWIWGRDRLFEALTGSLWKLMKGFGISQKVISLWGHEMDCFSWGGANRFFLKWIGEWHEWLLSIYYSSWM